MEKKITSHMLKGIIIGLIMIVIFIITYFSGVKENGIIQWLGYLIFFAGVIFSIKQYGKQIGYVSSFGDYFTHGFKTSAIVTLITIAFVIIFINIFPEAKVEMWNSIHKANVAEKQADQGIARDFKFYSVIISFKLINNIVFGAFSSIVGAAVTKRYPPPVILEENNQSVA